ncbi:MAG: hypothetical protein JSV68_03300, partial [Anaerolineaceae bacterium]
VAAAMAMASGDVDTGIEGGDEGAVSDQAEVSDVDFSQFLVEPVDVDKPEVTEEVAEEEQVDPEAEQVDEDEVTEASESD